MNNLDKLEKKVEERGKVFTSTLKEIKGIDTDKILEEIQRVYRLCSKTNNREERRLQYIEDKLNKVLELLKYKEDDTEDLKKLQEIEELELKLRELKGEV